MFVVRSRTHVLVVVAGFHRSGTSFVARLMSDAGLFMGDQLLGSAKSNRHGHYEDREVLDIHNRILSDNARSWRVADDFIPVVNDDIWHRMQGVVERRMAAHEHWGFKDPRACLFLPLWRHLVPDLRVLAVVRHPTECVRSLEWRAASELFDGLGDEDERFEFWRDRDLALKMWILYNRSLKRSIHVNEPNALVVSFAGLQAGESLVHKVNSAWSLDLDEVPSSEILNLADVHWRGETQILTDDLRLRAVAEQLWRELEQLSELAGDDQATASRLPTAPGRL